MLLKRKIDTYLLDKKCSECEEGIMLPTHNEIFTIGNQRSIMHKCDKCGHTEMLTEKYPRLMHKIDTTFEPELMAEEDINIGIKKEEKKEEKEKVEAKKKKTTKAKPSEGDSIVLT